jgi:pimeloyl-ACP methyl ester carboxylesterase
MKKTVLLSAIIVVLTALGSAQAPQSHWATMDGNKIHYLDIGESKNKKALVFIHGWTGNADLWSESYSAFPGYRVIALDLIGHGKSDKPKTEYNMDLFARSVETVLKHAKVDKAVLVGHSMGNPVARQVYRHYPGKVIGIVNVDGAIRAFPDKKQFEGFVESFRADYRKAAAAFIDSMLVSLKDEKLKETIHRTNQMTPDYVAISAFAGFGNDDLWKTDQIKVPVLALFAESPWWPADTETFYRSIAPELEFQMWKGVTHFLMLERPKEFNGQIKAFIIKNKLL